MVLAVARILVVMGVLAGIVLPKSSVVLAQLGLIDAQVMVICTGSGLETLVLDRDGTPVAVEDHAHACLLVHAIDTAVPPRAPAHTMTFAAFAAPALAAAHVPAARPASMARPRAPPSVSAIHA